METKESFWEFYKNLSDAFRKLAFSKTASSQNIDQAFNNIFENQSNPFVIVRSPERTPTPKPERRTHPDF
ncbi:MAG: hypothetical protein HWD61_15070 [Parachlamydiaceae bacterium]|nr:MAG: hypothetical protein HWD61_15070 [Parachlamydiaceae bacterium]